MLNNRLFVTLVFSAFVLSACSQETIEGTFSAMPNETIRLIGYSGFDSYQIDEAKTDSNGNFSFKYGVKDYGCGYILGEKNQSYIVILNSDEKLIIRGSSLNEPDSIQTIQGRENLLFDKYLSDHQKREKALIHWDNLLVTYSNEAIFSSEQSVISLIHKEKDRINLEDSLFLLNLPENSFVADYLPLRKLISASYTSVRYRPANVPKLLNQFRQIDYQSKFIFRSGLIKKVLETHFWLIENSGLNISEISEEMETSIDSLISNLSNDSEKMDQVLEYLFNYLEKRSLSDASEYLAKTLLESYEQTLSEKFIFKLEAYRATKEGEIAPDIIFSGDLKLPDDTDKQKKPKALSYLNSKSKLIMFGSSACLECQNELKALTSIYDNLKENNIEVVLIALDESKDAFHKLAKDLPFIVFCDYRGNQGQSVKDFRVFATPTYFLLSSENEILLKPNSIEHLKAWVSWKNSQETVTI